MDKGVKNALRREFRAGEKWGWKRQRAEHGLFFDNRHKPLTPLTKRQILIALMWANYYATETGAGKLRLYFDEKRLWQRHFQNQAQPTNGAQIWQTKRRPRKNSP